MKKIYLVRHGESESNAGGVMRGAETPLSEKGHEQAKFIAERATKLPIEIIISSTMLRARQTAQYIVEATGKPIEFTDLIVERRSPSGFDGFLSTDPKVADMDKALERNLGVQNYQFSDEETFEEIRVRVKQALDFLANRPEKEILIVSHGMFLKMLTGTILFGDELTSRAAGLMVRATKTQNTGLTIFEYIPENEPSAQWRMLVWNDHAHLAD